MRRSIVTSLHVVPSRRLHGVLGRQDQPVDGRKRLGLRRRGGGGRRRRRRRQFSGAAAGETRCRVRGGEASDKRRVQCGPRPPLPLGSHVTRGSLHAGGEAVFEGVVVVLPASLHLSLGGSRLGDVVQKVHGALEDLGFLNSPLRLTLLQRERERKRKREVNNRRIDETKQTSHTCVM